MSAKSFIKDEKYKLLATFIVTGFFIYFWLEGPLQQTDPIINLEEQQSEFAKPKLVHDLKEGNQSGFNTVEDAEVGGYGHSLILENKEKETSGLIVNPETDLTHSKEFAEALVAHAANYLGEKVELKATEELYFAQTQTGSAFYFESTGLVNDIRGYSGPINIGVVVSESGEIKAVHHISSRETESYLKKIVRKGFYSQFENLPLKSEHDLDAVSGATLTTEAIAKTTSALVQKAMPEPLVTFADASEMTPFVVKAKLSWWWIAHIVVIFLMFLYGFQKKLRKTKTGLILLSILSVTYIGLFLNNSFTYISFIHPFVGTSVSSLVGLYSLFVLLGAIWGKNTYCKYVCPFGNVQRLVLQVSPKKTRSKFFISNKWINRIRLAIAIVLLTGVMLGLRSWSNFELFPDLFGLEIKTLWFFLALISVLFTVRYPMIWCRLLCPTGSILDLISDAVKPKKRKVNKKSSKKVKFT